MPLVHSLSPPHPIPFLCTHATHSIFLVSGIALGFPSAARWLSGGEDSMAELFFPFFSREREGAISSSEISFSRRRLYSPAGFDFFLWVCSRRQETSRSRVPDEIQRESTPQKREKRRSEKRKRAKTFKMGNERERASSSSLARCFLLSTLWRPLAFSLSLSLTFDPPVVNPPLPIPPPSHPYPKQASTRSPPRSPSSSSPTQSAPRCF